MFPRRVITGLQLTPEQSQPALSAQRPPCASRWPRTDGRRSRRGVRRLFQALILRGHPHARSKRSLPCCWRLLPWSLVAAPLVVCSRSLFVGWWFLRPPTHENRAEGQLGNRSNGSCNPVKKKEKHRKSLRKPVATVAGPPLCAGFFPVGVSRRTGEARSTRSGAGRRKESDQAALANDLPESLVASSFLEDRVAGAAGVDRKSTRLNS